MVFGAAFIAAAAALDQLTKAAAGKLRSGPKVLIPGILELRYLENRGAAFGILRDRQWLFIAIACAVITGALVLIKRLPLNRRFLPLGISVLFLAGGAAGNLLDRVRLHMVRDFIYIRAVDFPIFNLADIFVTCSAASILLLVLIRYRDDEFDFLRRRRG